MFLLHRNRLRRPADSVCQRPEEVMQVARPRKTTTLHCFINVRVSPEEFAEISRQAQVGGLPASTWLRKIALGRTLPVAKPAATREAWGILGRVLAGIGMLKVGRPDVDPKAFEMLAELVELARRTLVS